MPCNFDCDWADCSWCLTTAIEDEIFGFIQSEQKGEINEEWYENKLDLIRHEEVDDFINRLCTKRCEEIVFEYGIHKSLKLYKDNFGEIPINDDIDVCKTLAYVVIDDMLSLQYENYKNWCDLYPLEELEGEETK